jgi:hypothetical protein
VLFNYYIGLDLGQSSDYTALSLVEEPVWVSPPGEWRSPSAFVPRTAERLLAENFHLGRPPNPPLAVRHLERLDLGTPYPRIVERVGALLRSATLDGRRVAFLVDKTGVGAAVVDAFEHSGLAPISVTIHGGSAVGREPKRRGYRVPKRDLVSAVQVLLQNGELKIAEALPEAATLKKELLNFRVKIDPRTAHDSYEHWREGDHDDLVLATAMACWYRQWHNSHLDARNAEAFPRRGGPQGHTLRAMAGGA